MTMTTLIKKTFNWGWHRVSKVQSIIIMVGYGSIQADMVIELKVLHLKDKRKYTETLGGILSIGNLKIHSNSDKSSNKATPPPIRPHLFIVPLPTCLWGLITFKLPH